MLLHKSLTAKKVLLAAGLLLSISYQSNAQLPVTYTHAVLQLKNGDTASGYLRNDEVGHLNYSVPFKRALTDTITLYTSTDVTSVQTDNKVVYEQITFCPDGDTVLVTVLGRLLASGKAKLYEVSYTKAAMYVVSNNGKTYPLQRDKLGQNGLADEVHNYLNYLSAAVADRPPTGLHPDDVPFARRSLLRYLTAYNTQYGNAVTMDKSRELPAHFILAGINGIVKNHYEDELWAHIAYRTYYPQISRTTAINIGFNFSVTVC